MKRNSHSIWRHLLAVLTVLSCGMSASAELPEATLIVGATTSAGNRDIAPHYIMANRGGTITQQYNALVNAAVTVATDTMRRLSWGAALEVWGGYSSSADYARYDAAVGDFVANSQHPSPAWIQQAYIEGKYRGLLATLGAKQYGSALLNDRLSSGDLVRSANSRPIPGLQVGFVNYQNVPFTRGWLQIDGEVGFFRTADSKWLENHYNYYNNSLTTGQWTNYQRLYLRSHPGMPVVVTVGLQSACQFGGTRTFYYHGQPDNNMGQPAEPIKYPTNFKAFFHALIPGHGDSSGDEFAEGNHLGTIDLAAAVRLPAGRQLRAYTQWIWEDGSGLGKKNGFDGLWGLEYSSSQPAIVDGIVLEYLDLTNQSGPIHWAPGDHPGTPLTDEATGADNYYNNFAFNGYQSRGMAIGSPMVVEPLRNTDGYMSFADNAVRAIHGAISGHLGTQWQYRLMASRRKSLGTPIIPHPEPRYATSLFAEIAYSPASVAGLTITAQLATDRGSLLGNNTGGLISASYRLPLKKKTH